MMRLHKINRLIAIVAFILIIAPLSSQAQLNESGGYMQAVKEIENALPACEEALKRVDVDKLSVSYEDGKIFDEWKSIGLKYIIDIREILKDVKDEVKIKETIILLDILRSFLSSNNALAYSLSNKMNFQKTTSFIMGMDWARALQLAQQPLHTATNKFFSSTVDIALWVDTNMKSCAQNNMNQFLSKPSAK